MSYTAGSIFLQVIPSYDNFQKSLRRQAVAAAKAAEADYADNFDIGDVLDRKRGDARKGGDRLGREISGSINRVIQKDLDKALRSLPKVVVGADTSKANREIAALRGRLEEIKDAHLRMDLDATSARVQIQQVTEQLVALHRTAERGSDVDIDTAGAIAALVGMDKVAQAATRDRKMTVEVDTDRSKLDRLMGTLRTVTGSGDEAANSFRAFNAILLAVALTGAALIPIIAGLAGGLMALLPVLAAAGLGAGALVLGLSGIPSAVSAMNDAQKDAAKDALSTSKTMRGAANGVRDAEIALARARQDAARSQADAARRVADARRSLADAERRASDIIQTAVEREKDARQRLADVTRRTEREIETANRRVADAKRAFARASEDAAQRNAAAAQTVARAEARVVEAQQAATRAQEDLLDARRRAEDQLEDLALRAAGGALAEREAVMAVADAKREYDRVMNREFKSARSVEEVTVAYEQAQLALERVRLENARTAEEQAEAAQKGVEGSDLVVGAKERVADAQQAERDAIEAAKDAAADAEQARLDGIERVEDAQRRQIDSVRELREAERDGAREVREAQAELREATAEIRDARLEAARVVADAERGVADALRDQGRAAVDARQALADANRRLADSQLAYQDALTQTSVLGSSAMQKLRDEMAELSPAGQAFAAFIFGLKDEFLALRRVAEEGLLPGLQTFLTDVIDRYGPGFTKWVGTMAKVTGDLWAELGQVMTTNPVWQEFFAAFGKLSPKLYREFGQATINWLTVFVALLDAFLPLAEMASGWLLRMSESAAAWASGLEDTKGFQDFMGWLERVLPKVGDFFGAFFTAVIDLGIALAPLGELLLDLFTGLLRAISAMPPGLLQALVFGFLALTVAIQGTLAIVTIALTQLSVLATPFALVTFAVLLVIAALVALYVKFDWFRSAVDTVAGAIGDVFKWLWHHGIKPFLDMAADRWDSLMKGMAWAWENVLKPAWDAIEKAATWLWEKVLKPTFGFIKDAWSTMSSAMKTTWDNVLFPVIDLVSTIVWELWKFSFKLVFEAIKLGWEAVAWAFGTVWRDVLKPAWDTISTGIESVWKNVLKPVFDAFMTIIGDDLVEAFKEGVRLIGNAWDGLQELAKKPVKFVIETIMNKGLIGTFNKVADFFGTKNIPEIPLPKGFATGGYTGPGGRYEPAGIVHRDEYVISSPARRSFEAAFPGALDYINATGRFPGYAKGGIVRPVAAAFGLPYGNTYSDGSFHSGQDFPASVGTVVRAIMAAVVQSVQHLAGSYGNHVVLRHPGGAETLYAHMAMTSVRPGQVIAAGTPVGLVGSTGNSSGPHLHFEFRRPPGGYSNAIDPRGILGGAVEGKGDGGFFPDWLTNPFGFLKGKVTGFIDELGDSPYAGLIGGMPRMALGLAKDAIGGMASGVVDGVKGAASATWDFVNGPFGGAGSSLPDNGTAMYDNGGYLPPGITTVVNATGKPEPVFTSGQWAALQGAGAGSRGVPGVQIGTMVAADTDEAVRKIRTSQSDAAAMADLRSIAAGV